MRCTAAISLIGLALVSTLSLSGCFSGEPSESEMKNALHNNPKFRQGVGYLMMAGNLAKGSRSEPDVDALLKTGTLEKSSCTAAQGSPGYVCDFRWGLKQADGKVSYGQPAKARFFKVGSNWNVET